MRHIGKWIGTAICVLLLLVDATMARNFHPSSVVRHDISTAVGQIGGQLPDFTLPDMNGNQVTLSHFYGKGSNSAYVRPLPRLVTLYQVAAR